MYMPLLEVVLIIMTRDIGSTVEGWVKPAFNDCHNSLSVILNSPETLKFLRTLNHEFFTFITSGSVLEWLRMVTFIYILSHCLVILAINQH